jgi:hypothetical protein
MYYVITIAVEHLHKDVARELRVDIDLLNYKSF